MIMLRKCCGWMPRTQRLLTQRSLVSPEVSFIRVDLRPTLLTKDSSYRHLCQRLWQPEGC